VADHVLIRKLEHLSKGPNGPALRYAIETRSSAGPAFKEGAFPQDIVWLKLHGGLVVGKAQIKIAWVGEFSSLGEIRARTRGAPIHDNADFWAGRPKVGYAVVAELAGERWIEPRWQGPRTYGYEWVVLDNDKKVATWMEDKPPPRGGDELAAEFERWKNS
jgi:hypothetical protein